MSDASQRRRVQAKLRELIERASTAAEINFKNGKGVTPQGFAIRENGSRFVFEPIPPASNGEMSSIIRATFAQEKVVCTSSLRLHLPKASSSFCLPPKMNLA